jgi:hypothetical protein
MTGFTVRAFAEKAEVAFSTMVRLEAAGNAIPPGNIESAKWEFVGHEYLFRDDDIVDNYDRDFYLAKNK